MTTITIIIAISISIPGFGNNSVDGGSDDSWKSTLIILTLLHTTLYGITTYE